MKKWLAVVFMLAAVCLRAQDITGFWQTFYDNRNQDPKSVIAVYKYNGDVYARVMLMYHQGSRGTEIWDTMYNQKAMSAPNVVRIVNGQKVPVPMAGLDVIWNMHPGRGRTWLYEGGIILDPLNGNEYRGRMKLDRDGNLVVRGHLRISSLLGRSHTAIRFNPANFPAGFAVPDYTTFVPDIPTVK